MDSEQMKHLIGIFKESKHPRLCSNVSIAMQLVSAQMICLQLNKLYCVNKCEWINHNR